MTITSGLFSSRLGLKFCFAIICTLSCLVMQSGQAHAFQTVVLPDYDAVFPGLCGGTACEQAVPEARNGDNGTSAAEAEWNNGPTTLAPSETINISTAASGFWADEVTGVTNAREFSLTYDGTELSLTIDSGGLVSDETASYTVDLSPTQSMYIRAVSRSGAQDTFLRNLQLDGTDVNGGTFSADSVADYLAIYDFDWSMNWSMTGTIDMEGNDAFPNSRPSIQWKLTDLVVPEPTGLVGLMVGLLALLTGRKRG